MAVFSTLRQKCRILTASLLRPNSNTIQVAKRSSSDDHHRTLHIEGSLWNWNKSKDLFHLYTCVACVIYGSIILYANLIVGQPILAEIPEGYRPKHWEYYRHPISRFLQRYCYSDEQELHETFLNELYNDDELMKLRYLDEKVRNAMKRNKDYQAYYYRPLTVAANVTRLTRKECERIEALKNDEFLEGYGPNFKDGEGAYDAEFPKEMGTPQV